MKTFELRDQLKIKKQAKRHYMKMLNGIFLSCPNCTHAMAKGDKWVCFKCGLTLPRNWRKEP